jgi:uncharacterized repeat protein (TIGR02543 family)
MKNRRVYTVFLCIIIASALIAGDAFAVFGDAGGPSSPPPAAERVSDSSLQQGPEHIGGSRPPEALTSSSSTDVQPEALSDSEAIERITAEPVEGAEYDGYIVKLSGDAGGRVDLRAMRSVASDTLGDEIAVVERPGDALEFADAGDIDVIEPNYKLTAFDFPQTDPADPIYIDAGNYQWGTRYVNAGAAWQAGYRGKGVNIAIVDTGIVNGHEDLSSNKIINQYDWVHRDDNAEDDNMHGSVVGGIIAADINNYELGTANGVGMAGITDEANLTVHKVLDSNGDGDVLDILYAYYDILEDGNRIDVINLSLGHEGYLKVEDEMVQEIVKSGVIMVAATGNNGAETDGSANTMNYPAGYDGVIGVGSIGRSGGISSFSTKNKSVDVAAPGEQMVGLEYNTRNGYYVNFINTPRGTYPLDGTSFAAPVVAAAAAIAKQRDKSIDSGAFLTALKASSRDAGSPGYDTSYGNGILDIGSLVNYLQTKSITINFNANGGKVGTKIKAVWPGGKYGGLPTPTRKGYGFGGWYTSKKGGTKITSISTVNRSSNQTLYAHWQGGTTLSDLKPGVGKLSPAFSFKKMNYKLTLTKKQASVKITATKSYKSAKMQMKVGSGKYRTKSSVKVKLARGKSATVCIKLTKKGMKTKVYKVNVRRKK